MSDQDLQKLAELRAKIDMADQSIHALLMQRAEVIDELIKAKGASRAQGAAFRPGREAQMMEVLRARHGGSIPFSTIVHMWREIISTFTWLQAPYAVHMPADPDGRLTDTVRFQFGFTVQLERHETIGAAMDAAAQDGNAIAVVPVQSNTEWWPTLGGDTGLHVMARLPVAPVPFETVDALALAPRLSDPVPFEWRAYVVTAGSRAVLDDWDGGVVIDQRLTESDGAVEALIALAPGAKTPTDLLDIRAAGGYFAPLTDQST
ncbi:MAG: chorismate mutase [Pseudomonadota bacterium]